MTAAAVGIISDVSWVNTKRVGKYFGYLPTTIFTYQKFG